MAETDILNKKELFNKLLSQGRLNEAMALLRTYSEKRMLWEVTDRINRVRESYHYMLRYAMDNVADPHRDVIYNNIKEDLRVIFNQLLRAGYLQSSSLLYYSTLRSGNLRAPSAAVEAYRKLLQSNDAFSVASGKSQGATVLELESLESALFDSTWLAYPYAKDDETALMSLINDIAVPAYVKSMAISGIMLGSLEFFDVRRALILANTYAADALDEQLRMTALTALMIVLYMSRAEEFPSSLISRIEMLRDIPSWQSDIKTVYLELIRTRDTDRITSKLRDEIVPEMIKMKPEIEKRMKKSGQKLDPAEIEENPEWQDFLDSSGIADKMKELSEMQEEGGDVLMATFSQLKSYPFFYNISNWFLPFHSDHSVVSQLGDETDVLGELIAQSFFMCDSDKYSFVLAFALMPPAQRNMMVSQIRAQNINAAEIQNASLNLGPETRRNIVNKYVQNLYRFFRLFRRRGDFNNPFASEINLTEVKPLQADFLEDSTLQLVGEFYFKHKYYREALGVFRLREKHTFPDDTLYQKIGYCEQQLGNIAEAIKYYEQSELLAGSSVWTVKRLAVAHKQLGHYAQALDYYKRLDAMQPDKFSTVMNIGQCQLALEQYEEASKSFYKARYLDETSEKPMRLLAWAQFMQRDFEGAREMYDKILDTAVQPDDFLNRGHVSLAMRNYSEAVDYYRKYVTASRDGWQGFVQEMQDDRDALLRAGVDRDILPLVIDSVMVV